MTAKRYMARLGLFLLIGSTLYALAREFPLVAGAVYKDGASIICEQKREAVRTGQLAGRDGPINVLFMGNSKILSGLIPEVFDAECGGATWSLNLSLPASPIGPHYFYLRDYLRRNPAPAWVIMLLEVNDGITPTLFDQYGTQGARWDEALSYALHRRSKTVVLNWIFPQRMYGKALGRYAFNALFNREDLRKTRLRNRNIADQMLNDRGYYFIQEQARTPDFTLPEEVARSYASDQRRAEFDPRVDPYVGKFFRLAASRGIRVLLIEQPCLEGQFLPNDRMPSHDEMLMREYPHVRMAARGWQLKFYDRLHFSDYNHLNPAGARLYTRDIAREFLEVSGRR